MSVFIAAPPDGVTSRSEPRTRSRHASRRKFGVSYPVDGERRPVSTRTETLEFQAEARQLLQLMVHSVYSNKDIFLRELISNASDALDKLRLESMLDKDLDVDTADLHIELEADKDTRTLTVRDNGIGMSRDEVIG